MRNSILKKGHIRIISLIGLAFTCCEQADALQRLGSRVSSSFPTRINSMGTMSRLYGTNHRPLFGSHAPELGCQEHIRENKELSKVMHVTWLPLMKTLVKIEECKHSGEKDCDSLERYMKLFDELVKLNEGSMPYRYDPYSPYDRGFIDYCIDTSYGISNWEASVRRSYLPYKKNKKSLSSNSLEIHNALEHLGKVKIAYFKMMHGDSSLTE